MKREVVHCAHDEAVTCPLGKGQMRDIRHTIPRSAHHLLLPQFATNALPVLFLALSTVLPLTLTYLKLPRLTVLSPRTPPFTTTHQPKLNFFATFLSIALLSPHPLRPTPTSSTPTYRGSTVPLQRSALPSLRRECPSLLQPRVRSCAEPLSVRARCQFKIELWGYCDDGMDEWKRVGWMGHTGTHNDVQERQPIPALAVG